MEEIEKKNLKIQALGESFSNKAVQYENQVADLRVELTLLANELDEAKKKIAEYESSPNSASPEED